MCIDTIMYFLNPKKIVWHFTFLDPAVGESDYIKAAISLECSNSFPWPEDCVQIHQTLSPPRGWGLDTRLRAIYYTWRCRLKVRGHWSHVGATRTLHFVRGVALQCNINGIRCLNYCFQPNPIVGSFGYFPYPGTAIINKHFQKHNNLIYSEPYAQCHTMILCMQM